MKQLPHALSRVLDKLRSRSPPSAGVCIAPRDRTRPAQNLARLCPAPGRPFDPAVTGRTGFEPVSRDTLPDCPHPAATRLSPGA